MRVYIFVKNDEWEIWFLLCNNTPQQCITVLCTVYYRTRQPIVAFAEIGMSLVVSI